MWDTMPGAALGRQSVPSPLLKFVGSKTHQRFPTGVGAASRAIGPGRVPEVRFSWMISSFLELIATICAAIASRLSALS